MITSPIGLPELSGKEPAVIAVGVAAKLIMTMFPARARRSFDRLRTATYAPELVEGQGGGPSTGSGHDTTRQTQGA